MLQISSRSDSIYDYSTQFTLTRATAAAVIDCSCKLLEFYAKLDANECSSRVAVLTTSLEQTLRQQMNSSCWLSIKLARDLRGMQLVA